MPHLCLVTDEFAPGTKGGIGRLLLEVVRDLTANGWAVTVLLLADAVAHRKCLNHAAQHLPRCRVLRVDDLLREADSDDDVPLWAFHFLPYHQSYRIALALRHLLKSERFDLVEFADYKGLGYVTLKLRRLWGEPFHALRCWVRLHGTYELWQKADETFKHSRQELQTFQMERYCLRHSDGWFCPSASVASWYRSYYAIDAKPISVSVPPFQRLGPGFDHHRTIRRPIEILFYGKVQHLKGVDDFVRAGVQLCERTSEPVTFHLVGHDVRNWALGKSYQATVRELIPPVWQHRFKFYGRILPEALPALAQRCSAAVIPSRVETFCLAAHELNWIGIPLILRDLPAFEDLFTDGQNCRKFDLGQRSVQALTDTLRDLIERPDQIKGWVWNVPEILSKQRLSGAYQTPLAQALRPVIERATDDTLVSVIIPFFNADRTIESTLRSVEASTHSNIEIIVIDDGSTSPKAQAEFDRLTSVKRLDTRYRFVRKSNGGLSSARNAGLEAASGAFVLPLDADDLIAPDYLALAVRALVGNPDLGAVSCFAAYFPDGRPESQIIDYVIAYDLDPLLITLENRAGVAGSVFRRDRLPQPAYRETLPAYEDWDLWWTLAEAGVQAEVMPRVLYRYRRRSDGLYATIGRAQHEQLVRQIEAAHPTLLSRLPTRDQALRQMEFEATPGARLRRRLRDLYIRLLA